MQPDRPPAQRVVNLGAVRTHIQSNRAVDTPMSDTPTREEIDAKVKIAAVETEVKLTRLDGKLDLVISKLGDIAESNRSTRANQWVIGLGLAVLIVAVAGLFPVFFGMGAQVRDMVRTEVQQSLPAPAPQAPKTP